jgi:hypothetical protein
MSKPIVKKTTEKPYILNDNRPQNIDFVHQKSGPLVQKSPLSIDLAHNERQVQPLNAEFTDLLAAPKPQFQFKSQFLPVAAILVFSLVLVLFYHYGKSPLNSARGVAGDLNDLSNGQYQKQAADYSEEKVCTEHSDGTKSCTTKTKLRREFR